MDASLAADWPEPAPGDPSYEADLFYAERPPLFDLLDVYGSQGDALVNVVFLQRMERRPGGLAGAERVYVGTAVDARPEPAEPPFGPVSYPQMPTPTMFVNVKYIKRAINFGAHDLIIDHRMAGLFAGAHGLPFVQDDDGTPQAATFDGDTSGCYRDFTAEQVALLKAALEVAASP